MNKYSHRPLVSLCIDSRGIPAGLVLPNPNLSLQSILEAFLGMLIGD